MAETSSPLVLILMGSASDWETMKHAPATLDRFGVGHESRVASAHRSPELALALARGAEARGIEAIIAGAGAAAHLAGVVAAHTGLPVLGVPLPGGALDGLDALLSTVQMPRGVPVATFAIGKAGAVNAALFALRLLARTRPALREALERDREEQARAIEATELR